jgi:hypothetical protein
MLDYTLEANELTAYVGQHSTPRAGYFAYNHNYPPPRKQGALPNRAAQMITASIFNRS